MQDVPKISKSHANMTIGKRHLLPNDDPSDLSRNCGSDVPVMDRKVSEQQRAICQLQSRRRNMAERTTQGRAVGG